MRRLRHALWLRFHIWTLGLLATLTAVNVSTQLRPYESAFSTNAGPSLRLADGSNVDTGRQPASAGLSSVFTSDSHEKISSTRALKLASIGCEPSYRLTVSGEIRQLRLKFDVCPTGLSNFDDVVQVSNATNGFQATVFSAESLAASADARSEHDASIETEMPGVFLAAESPTPKNEKDKAKPQARRPSSEPVSTDYISLAEGSNEIRIQRTDREQRLQIQRK